MNLIVFNFEMDENSKVLSHSVDWVNHLAEVFEKVFVITLREGEYRVKKNVEVYSLKRDSVNRIISFYLLAGVLFSIHRKNSISGYFVHMATAFVPVIYLFSKIFNQKILLWYAHKSTSLLLRVSSLMVYKIFTPSRKSYRLISSKVEFTGHCIDLNKFPLIREQTEKFRDFAIIGRISPIKNIDVAIKVFKIFEKEFPDVRLYIYGDAVDEKGKLYLEKLNKLLEGTQNVFLKGHVEQKNLHEELKNIDCTINLSDTGSLDKAIIESMAMGIPVITWNDSAKELFNYLRTNGVFIIEKTKYFDQIKKIINSKKLIKGSILREAIQKDHSLTRLIKKIKKFF